MRRRTKERGDEEDNRKVFLRSSSIVGKRE